MREDFIAPLRLGICDYLKEHSGRDNQGKFQDVRIYEKVRVSNVICNRGNLLYQLSFNKSHFRRIKWETSRRLIFGSLLCLSPDYFETVLFASVVNREVDKLKQGLIEVKLENENGGISCMTKRETQLIYTMAESPAFFEAYRHVLLSLKMINAVNLPFQDFIVHMKTEHTPPSYLKLNPICDLTFMLTTCDSPRTKAILYSKKGNFISSDTSDTDDSEEYEELCISRTHKNIYQDALSLSEFRQGDIITTDLSTWPTKEDLGLDDAQRKAMQLAFSSSVAVIQGPPGTGKTYIGLKIVEALLRNHPNVTPILVVCFTNHALDQFLEGILTLTTKLVRVGSRSESKDLEPYNLNNKRNFSSGLGFSRHYLKSDLESFQKIISSYKEDLKCVNSFILHEKALDGITEPDQAVVKNIYSSFEEVFEYSLLTDSWPPHSVLAAWLGLTTDDLVNEYELHEFYLQETAKNPRNEAEKETEEEVYDAVDSDDDVVDVEDEVSAETKKRMLDDDHDFVEDRTARTVAEHSKCWALNVKTVNDLYFVYGLQRYRCYTLKQLQSSKESDPKVHGVLWLRRNYKAKQRHFDMLKTIAERELALTDSMADGEITEELNVWKLSLGDRWRLYRRWLKLFQEKRKREIEELQQRYIDIGKQLKDIRRQEDFSVLKDCDVIGMTTTGAARYQPILYEIGCKIVIIEEAAEVLESHIISSLNRKTEHLILIGDHLQLRPKPTVYYLAKKFNLDISLFERLIKNGLPYETLKLQHRMRPEISQLIISHIYPSLLNHPSVHKYPHVRGMKNDIFFVSHSEIEEEVGDKKSHENKFEAEYLVGLCHYLLLQGYNPNQITILSMYSGQVFAVQRLMPKRIYEGVRVVPVDNYQGEENDIILLSLVRSNEEGKVGFVKIENRINVALSRARHGLYAVGNFQFLADNSDFWKRLMVDLQKNHLIGKSLNIFCKNHPECQAFISNGKEFQQHAPEGGCVKNCEAQLPCGHICPRVCHLDDHGKCTQPCAKQCPEVHPCPLRCFEECEPCKEIVRKNLPCRHSGDIECSTNPEDYECLELVEITLPYCQHRRNAECYQDVYEVECLEDCEYRLDCRHKCELKCHLNDDPEHINIPCYKSCERTICKEHNKICINKCYEDCSICDELVLKSLPCGHKTEVCCGLSEVHCKEGCDRLLVCGHQCSEKCGAPCVKECKELVEKYLSCGHRIIIECFTQTEYKCQHPCSKILPCGHVCQNLCYDLCTVECKEIVNAIGVCQHEIKVECHYSILHPELLSLWCEVPCSEFLPCEHQCSGTCGECWNGRLHAKCSNTCGRVRICGHVCDNLCPEKCIPCNKRCPIRCPHTECSNQCGNPCKKCKEPCEWKCSHYSCSRKCNDDCDRPPCNEPCPEKLSCQHPCVGLCGETCPTVCRECDPEKLNEFILSGLEDQPGARFNQLEDCRHCFEVSGLDHWMNKKSPEIQMKSCPRCKMTIWNSYRYGNIIRECIQTVTKSVCGVQNKNRQKMKQMHSVIKSSETIKKYFPTHYNTLVNHLSETYTLNHDECATIENQILLLKEMVNVYEYFSEVKDYIKISISLLAYRLMCNEQNISEYELNNISKEVRRIRLNCSRMELDRRITNVFQRLSSSSYIKIMGKIQEVKGVFDAGKQLSEQEESHCEKIVGVLLRIIGLGISPQEINERVLPDSTSYTEMKGKIQEMDALFKIGNQLTEEQELQLEKILQDLEVL